MPRAETGDDVGEPAMRIECFRQPEQSPGPAGFFGLQAASPKTQTARRRLDRVFFIMECSPPELR